jgi:hypothetical protein
MKRDHVTLSHVREASGFVSPPRVLVVAAEGSAAEAVKLAEALDEVGAETEVRLSAGGRTDHHGQPDAVIFAGTPGSYPAAQRHPVLIALTDGEPVPAGFDLVVSRPVSASALMSRLGDYLPRMTV